MPPVALLLILAFFGVGLGLLTVPVTQARFEKFITRYSLELTAAGRVRLLAYLTGRRRARVTCVLVAAVIGLFTSIPDNRVDFKTVPLLIGWLVGAVLFELAQRDQAMPPVEVRFWWTPLPTVAAVIAVLWTAAAVLLRGEGAPAEPLLLWGAGALGTMSAVRAVVRYIQRHSLRQLDPESPQLLWATTVDAVRGVTIGGVALALLCLTHVWLDAVPGPYAEASELAAVVSPIAIVSLLLMMAVAAAGGRLGRKWWAVAVVAVLPVAWAVPIKLAQKPPFGPQDAQASAQIELVRIDRLPAARAALGIKPDPQAGRIPDDPTLPREFLGRLVVARQAPDGAHYELFAFNRRTNQPVPLYGPHGAGWHGRWSLDLPARYSWLSDVVRARHGVYGGRSPMAATSDEESGLLWFSTGWHDATNSAPEDLQLVLMLVRGDDSYIYWATTIPSTTGRTYA